MLELENVINNSKKKLGSLREKLIGDNNQGRDNSNIINDLDEIISELTASLDSKIEDQDVTEQKQIQMELHESESLLKNAQELAHISHWKLDPSTMEVSGSDELFKIFGLTHDEATLEQFAEVVHPDDREMDLYHIRRGMEKGESWDIEHRVISKDGTEKWVHALGEAIKDDDGKIIMLMGTVQDITERRKIMEELRIKDLVFNASLSAQSTADINGIIDFVNPAFLELWGYKSKEEAIGGSVGSFFANPDDAVPILKVLTETGKWEGEFLAKRCDGSTFLSQGFASTMYNENGDQIGFQSINLNITKRKEVEQKLKESEEKFRLLFESIADPIHVIDADLKIIYFNPAFERWLKSFNLDLNIIGRTPVEAWPFIGERVYGEYQEIFKTKKIHIKEDWAHFNDIHTFTETRKIPILKSGNVFQVITIIRDFSERKKAEQKLKESEENFRKQNVFLNNILESLTHPLYVINVKDYTIALANSTASSEGLEHGQYCYNLTHNSNKPCEAPCICPLNVVKNTKKVCVVEHKHYDQEGNEKTYEIYGYPILNENGNVVQMIEYALNITDRKIAQQELKESERKYRGFVNNISDIIFEIDIKGKCSYVSHQLFDISGFFPEEMVGQNVFKFVHPDDLFGVAEEVKIAFNSEDNRYIEFRLRHKDGHYVSVSSRFSTTIIGEKRKLTGVLVNMTERKKANQKLKESEEFFRTITEQSLLGVIIIQDRIIKYVNDIALNYSGYSRDEVINLPETQILKFIYTEDRDIINQTLIDPNPNMVFRIITKEGNTKWIDIHTKTIYYKGKEAYLSAFLDITEKKEAENLIKDEITKLKELDELKNEFVYRASHELKTPLNSIVSASSLLIDSYQDFFDERVYGLINVINKGGKILDELIGDLLDVSRIDSEKLTIKKKKENIVEIIRNCTQEMIFLINKRNLNIEFKYLDKKIYMKIDKKRFEQVILNILSNSIKNTPSEGSISFNIKSEKKFIDISITDTGVGFTKKEKEKLFQKFGKIERHGKGMDIISEGTGLGLYISKEIVELHGGEIWVESKGRNKGSTIVIRLPYKK